MAKLKLYLFFVLLEKNALYEERENILFDLGLCRIRALFVNWTFATVMFFLLLFFLTDKNSVVLINGMGTSLVINLSTTFIFHLNNIKSIELNTWLETRAPTFHPDHHKRWYQESKNCRPLRYSGQSLWTDSSVIV